MAHHCELYLSAHNVNNKIRIYIGMYPLLFSLSYAARYDWNVPFALNWYKVKVSGN